MKFNVAKLAKVLVQLVVAAPAIVSAMKPIAKAITGPNAWLPPLMLLRRKARRRPSDTYLTG